MRDLFPTFVTVLAALLMNFPTVIAAMQGKPYIRCMRTRFRERRVW